jgi:hypothetical protein
VSASTPSQGEIRDYLLRRLPEARRARLEELYFRDDRVLDRIEEAEDQLVSDYVLGRLSPSDRKVFEDSLLGLPYYRDRIETTTEMRLRLSRHTAFPRGSRAGPALLPGRTGLLVVVALLLVLFLAALASALRLKKDLETATRAAARRAPTGLPVSAFVLPGEGGNPSATIRILRPASGPLVLVLPRALVRDAARPFRVAIRGGSRTVWESGVIRPGVDVEGDLAVEIPAGVPPPGRWDLVAAADGEEASVRALATVEIAGTDP